ncbi:hypothetical protein SAY87_017007 [Trapa incisa]|uniref:Uncharacterized protein n=2 Tax=Trapa TaxID=22665 RepID=A0AAN7R818_TRANT|nr:hypothetical protein SAY87_017007 [Trapa incisa]KAK4791585.1 hypothetical protein SAY86_031998 [Trapa natans]
MPGKRLLVNIRKASSLLKRSIRIAKLSTRHTIHRLILLRKCSWTMNPRKSDNQYRFLREYEFSPSSSPLIFCSSRASNRRRCRGAFRSFFYLCGCLGKVTPSAAMGGGDYYYYGPLALPPEAATGDAFSGDMDFESVASDGESVDQRAEWFIEKFYKEMRMQQRQSL